MQNIEILNEEIHQETNYLIFLRRWEKDLEEAEKVKIENAKKISELNSKISSYEKKLKSRDSLLKKMDKKMNEMKIMHNKQMCDMVLYNALQLEEVIDMNNENTRRLETKLIAKDQELIQMQKSYKIALGSYQNAIRLIFNFSLIKFFRVMGHMICRISYGPIF